MERLTSKYWRNLDPWEMCGQDNYCKRGCHDQGGCTKGCIVPRIYARLAAYEDTGLEPEDVRRLQQDWTSLIMTLDEMGGMPHLHELVQAEKDGRLSILSKSQDGTCGSCGHFNRIPGKRCGTCGLRSNYTDRWGRIDARRGAFTPSQSRKCCKQYIPREAAEAALAGKGGDG